MKHSNAGKLPVFQVDPDVVAVARSSDLMPLVIKIEIESSLVRGPHGSWHV